MKTPMQEFLEWLENSSNVKNDILDWEIVKENVLQKEKEQIIMAYDSSINTILLLPSGIKSEKGSAEDYYNRTYKK